MPEHDVSRHDIEERVYGVLKAKVLGGRRPDLGWDRHYRIHASDEQGKHYRVAINIRAVQIGLEAVRYRVASPFPTSFTEGLKGLRSGFTELTDPRFRNNLALDYIRYRQLDIQNRFNVNDEGDKPLSHESLIDRLEQLTEQARREDGADLYAFGRRFGPKRGKDSWFGFEPILGVHEAHMNQGGLVPYEEGNAIWQDGATLFRFGSKAGSGEQWVGTFIVFRAQTWKTDEHGNPDDPHQDLAPLVPSRPVAAEAGGDRL